jgi:NAD(P)-dependent dehydrogenase (short-subunit alcohol dehydrogenase family)
VNQPLAGRVGIVTGAARGIGRQLAEAFAEAGARVAVLDSNAEGAKETAEAIDGALAIAVDITDEDGVERAVLEVEEAFGSLDFLVNNAGIRHQASILDHDLGTWRRTLDVNLTGTFICTQIAARLMVAHGGGRIVNLASIAGALPFKNRAAYDASKAGIIALTKATAAELASQGITCNAIAPGVIETPLSADYFKDEQMVATVVANTPLGRWGQVDEISNAALFLCGDASEFIQGHTLFVDGGWMATKGY